MRLSKKVQEGLSRMATAAGAGAGCEDVGGDTCDGEKCRRCEGIRKACDWIWDRLCRLKSRKARIVKGDSK